MLRGRGALMCRWRVMRVFDGGKGFLVFVYIKHGVWVVFLFLEMSM